MNSHLLAQVIYNPALNIRIGTVLTNNSAAKVQNLLRIIIELVFMSAGIYLFFTLLRGGFEFITAGGDKDAVQNARKRIANALIGISLILSVFAITFIIQTLFGIPITNFNVPTV